MEGCANWKKATEKFAQQEKSNFHRICFEAVSSTVDVEDMLNQQAANEKQQNRDCFLKILSSMRFLARQGLALRGDGDESNSNLHQLLRLCGADNPALISFIEKKQLNTCTWPTCRICVFANYVHVARILALVSCLTKLLV